MNRFGVMDMADVSRVLGMSVPHDRGRRTVTINQRGYTENVIYPFNVKGCAPPV